MTIKKTPLSVAEALDFLLDAALASTMHAQFETVPSIEANGRVLAQAQTSLLDVPPLDNSRMDGYAVRSADCISGAARLRVSQRIPAGVIGAPLEAGTAARIFTGAIIPEGADAVVMQEHCVAEVASKIAADTATDAAIDNVIINHIPVAGECVRRRGEDIRCGQTVLAAGTRLCAQELGLAASVGLANLPIFPRLKVAVFFTGDELAMPGEVLKPGGIYNSNRFTLTGLLQNLGCTLTDFGIVADSLEATRATLRRAALEHDLVITSGGVSVGEEDHVKPAVEAEGRLSMWQIAMKPGKPLAFGEIRRDGAEGNAFFIGLPGNPVSSFVTFLLLVRPFILRLQGVQNVTPHRYTMRADFDWPKADRRNEFLRARINSESGLDIFPNQGSGVLTSTVWGDGLIDVPAGHTIARGDLVQFLPF